MLELKIALKYLTPKRRSLSTALLSLVSVGVITLVVWLVLVFLSITAGIERNWLSKLTSLYAPLRITPTEAYYDSYFYRVDSFAAASNYTLKTIGEKLQAENSDPYAVGMDMEIPELWSKPKNFRDPVKTAFTELEQLQTEFPDLHFQDYEIGGALLKLEMVQGGRLSYLSQMSYLLSLPEQNPHLSRLLLPSSEGAIVENGQIQFPDWSEIPILLPKSYRDSGVQIGDRGHLCYSIPSAASNQEQRIAVRAAGFYDPGLLALGNRCLLVPSSVTRLLYNTAQTYSPDGSPTNGIFVWPKKLDQLPTLQKELRQKFQSKGIDRYWKVTGYEEYEFSKDLLQQFRSDRILFTLIAAIILLVACCNIVSLLILLVNDKKREIAILQAMGASTKSIASIFALCGAITGILSCLLGTTLAFFTLRNLNSIVSFLSNIQGRPIFHPVFFGQNLPTEITSDALIFVLIATPLLSFLAGLIPALKASRIRPSEVLKTE